MTYFAVTVTYGNRIEFLKKVIHSLVLEGVDSIIVVSNGSDNVVLTELKKLKKEQDIIEIIELKNNTGSANAFRIGIDYARKQNADFIWLLDDDNYVKKNALKELKFVWQLRNPHNNILLSLLSYRADRMIYKRAIQSENPYLMLGAKNSFLGFHVFQKFKSLFSKSKIKYNLEIVEGKVAVAPYGGMFFHKNLIDVIGLPDKDFFLYADDHEFSYRITQKGGEIILILKSELEDLETSFHLKKPKSILNTRYFGTDSKNAIFYSVRNNVFFEKNFRTNKFLYRINKYLYLIILFLIMIFHPKHFWKFSVIIEAIKDSKNLKK